MKPLQKLAIFLSSESLPTTSTTTCALCIHYDIHSVPSSSLPRRSYHTFIDPILLHEGIINLARPPILDHIDNSFPVKPIETRALHVSMTHSEYNVPFPRFTSTSSPAHLHLPPPASPRSWLLFLQGRKESTIPRTCSTPVFFPITRATIWGGY